MEIILLFSVLLSAFFTLIFLPKWIRKTKEIGFVWEDMNKKNCPKDIASSGGIVVVMAFVIGVLFYVAIRTFLIETSNGIGTEIFAVLFTLLLLSLIGFIDDLFGWKQEGLSIKFRLLLCGMASIPLIVINAGNHVVSIPFVGIINLGLAYPLLLIPLGIVGSTTTYNFLAGFNGLEAGQGILILSFLSFISYSTGSPWLSVIGLCMVASLIVFYFYNKFPAKVFPGDVLTYPVGGLIALMAILGNFEKIAVFLFIPYILETLLKLRGGLKKHSFGKVNLDGSLDMPYEKIYGLTHLSIFILKKLKKKVYEKDVTYLIFIFQIIIILVALVIFGENFSNA